MKKYKSMIILLVVINIMFTLVIFNLLNKSLNVRKEKQVVKEMTQSELESSLNDTIQQLQEAQNQYASDVQAYKKQIAQAVTNQGVATSENDTGAVIATNIGKILSTKTVATATAANILKDKTAWVNGTKVTGTMVNRGTLNWNPSTSTSYNMPAGYYSGGTLSTENAYNQGSNDKEPTIYTFTQSGISNGMTFDISSVEGYQNLVLYKNIFPVVTAAYASHTGATQGWNISYDSSTGKVTIVRDNTSKIATANRGTCYVLVW